VSHLRGCSVCRPEETRTEWTASFGSRGSLRRAANHPRVRVAVKGYECSYGAASAKPWSHGSRSVSPRPKRAVCGTGVRRAESAESRLVTAGWLSSARDRVAQLGGSTSGSCCQSGQLRWRASSLSSSSRGRTAASPVRSSLLSAGTSGGTQAARQAREQAGVRVQEQGQGWRGEDLRTQCDALQAEVEATREARTLDF
jgi:hypothetical protein